jgi:hypothetical protein
VAAKTKAELLAVTETEWAKLQKLLADVPVDLARVKDAEDTTIKDVVAHRAHWIGLFFRWYQAGQAGEPAELPAPGYKWSELKRYNADLRASQSGLDWTGAQEMLVTEYARLRNFITTIPEAALYGGPMPGGNNAWTTGRWAEAAGPSHFRSAAKYIRSRLRKG